LAGITIDLLGRKDPGRTGHASDAETPVDRRTRIKTILQNLE
jgi:hypothetical protein